MFYKDYLCVIRCDDLCSLPKCSITEIKLAKNLYRFTWSYRSLSQR